MTAADEQRSYRELAAICARLEAEAAHHLVGQQDLIRAKDHLDRELHRFRAIQAYIAGCLHTEDLEEFQTLTLEAIIEAFEFETALFLLAGERPDRLAVAAEFGFDEVPEDLAFDPAWTAQRESAVLAAGHPMLAAWPELDLAQA
ncbi:MAG: hypothetical protein QF491_13700, partial [Alphaproteobacteria bacterium]|nr:hypothetical protein [Alphaproteobacteria bacterium]